MEKLNDKLMYVIIGLMIVSTFFLRWAVNINLMYIVAIITLFYVVLNISKIDKNIIISVIVLAVYLGLNMIITASHTYYKSELFNMILLPIVILIFFVFFSKSEISKKDKFIFVFSKILNVYIVINTFIMVIQIISPGFMVHNFSNNPFYQDNITGLIGDSGTHLWSLIYIIAIYANAIRVKVDNSKSAKWALVFIILSSVGISLLNDNKYYFVVLFMFILPIIANIESIFKIKTRKIKVKDSEISVFFIASLILLVIGMVMTYYYYTNDNQMYLLKTERGYMFKFALTYNNSNPLIGHGIGSIRFFADENTPLHFGISEITSRVYTGGLINLILTINILFQCIKGMYDKMNIKKMIFIIISICLLCYYTQVFSNYYVTFLTCLLYYIFTKFYQYLGSEIKNE